MPFGMELLLPSGSLHRRSLSSRGVGSESTHARGKTPLSGCHRAGRKVRPAIVAPGLLSATAYTSVRRWRAEVERLHRTSWNFPQRHICLAKWIEFTERLEALLAPFAEAFSQRESTIWASRTVGRVAIVIGRGIHAEAALDQHDAPVYRLDKVSRRTEALEITA